METRNAIKTFAAFMMLGLVLVSCAGTPKPGSGQKEELHPPQTFSDEGSRYIRIDGINIHYKEGGSGNSLLLLHGMLGNVEGWRYIVPPLSEDYRVVAFDRPAFGLTERPPVNGQNNPYTPEEAEKITLGLIESLGLGKPILIGHSAGGNLALRLALHYPDRFSGLILISPGVYTEIPPALVRDLMELGVLKESGLELIRSIPEHIDELLAQTYYRPELLKKDLRDSYLIPTKVKNWDMALWNYIAAQDDSMLAAALPEINLPTLIIQGIRDQVVPPGDNLKTAAAMPDAELVFLPQCGHVAHEELPEQTVEIIRNFLGSGIFENRTD